MANEAVLKLRMEDPVDFIVADGAGIEKGCICKMTDPRTASASSGTGDVFAGIAAREKIASDGRTRLALYRRGIFDLKNAASSTITAGNWVATSGANLIRTAVAAELDTGKAIGIALEDAAADEVIEVMVGGF
jgi:hypothetical protein